MAQLTRCTALIAALMLDSTTSFADSSANFVMRGCRGFLDQKIDGYEIRQGFCAGVAETLIATGPKICAPHGVSNGQAVRVIVHYIDSRPARMHEPFIKLAAEAMAAAWPCK